MDFSGKVGKNILGKFGPHGMHLIGYPWHRKKDLKCFTNERDTHKVKRDKQWEDTVALIIDRILVLDISKLIMKHCTEAVDGPALRLALLPLQVRVREYKLSPKSFDGPLNTAFLVGLNMEFPS